MDIYIYISLSHICLYSAPVSHWLLIPMELVGLSKTIVLWVVWVMEMSEYPIALTFWTNIL